jgi:hypothetical protein
MTKRKLDIVKIAEALGIEPAPGQTSSELADACAERAAELVELVARYQMEARDEDPPPKGTGEARRRAEERRQQREHESIPGASENEAAPASRPKRERKSRRQAASEVGR